MKQTICLTMIVKNEIDVLKNAFDSVAHLLDYWVIADTGSDDGTQDFIKTYFEEKGIEGELYEDEWVNFAHNRQLVSERAKNKADYHLTIDADEVLVPLKKDVPSLKEKIKKLPKFKEDLVRVYTHLNPWVYKRAQLFRGSLDWKWAEGLHEYPYCEQATSEEFFDSFCIYTEGGGSRGKEDNRLEADVRELEKMLEEQPSGRNYYNLGMTHQSRTDYGPAIDAYTKCIELTSWDEEKYLAYLSKAACMHYSGRMDGAVREYSKATTIIPYRSEAYYYLAEMYFHKNEYMISKVLLEYASKLPFPKGELSLVDKEVTEWKIQDVLSLCYYEEGKYKEAYKLLKSVLRSKTVKIFDKAQRHRLENNFALFKRVHGYPRKVQKEIREKKEKE